MGTQVPATPQGRSAAKRQKWPWIVGIFVLIAILISRCGDDGGKDKETSASPPSSGAESTAAPSKPTTAPAEPVKAPIAIPAPLNFIEKKYGITVNAVDIGQHIVDGVDRERAIFDTGNWRIVAQCDFMTDNTLNAGVIKSDEFAVISQASQGTSISENFFKFLLDCPADETVPAESTTTAALPTSESAAPSNRPAPTDAQVTEAFQAYIKERADSGVMLAQSVTSVTMSGGVVTVTANPSPALLELSPFDNLAELFGSPVVFNNDESVWLRESVQRVDVIDVSGQSLGSMTAAELNKKATG
jgi:hypothetical protein